MKKVITEAKAIKILRKHNMLFLPGELMERTESLSKIEEDYSSYDKTIHVSKKHYQICKYDNVVDNEGIEFTFMVIFQYKGMCFVYESRRSAMPAFRPVGLNLSTNYGAI